jgi:RHS repeat-associated protein
MRALKRCPFKPLPAPVRGPKQTLSPSEARKPEPQTPRRARRRRQLDNLRSASQSARTSAPSQSAGRLAHSQTLREGQARLNVRQLLDCASPLALWQTSRLARLIAFALSVHLFALPSAAQAPTGHRLSAIGNPYLFQGASYDAETGFYYFRNRYYDPRAGRFLQRDPVWDEQNVGGWYTFVGNAPAQRLDPFGEDDDKCPPQARLGTLKRKTERVLEGVAAQVSKVQGSYNRAADLIRKIRKGTDPPQLQGIMLSRQQIVQSVAEERLKFLEELAKRLEGVHKVAKEGLANRDCPPERLEETREPLVLLLKEIAERAPVLETQSQEREKSDLELAEQLENEILRGRAEIERQKEIRAIQQFLKKKEVWKASQEALQDLQKAEADVKKVIEELDAILKSPRK